MAITVGGTSITFNDSTTQSSAGLTSAVTSVATGNGLQGGTITSTGTLSVACPSFNTVGSYCFMSTNNFSGTKTAGNNYSAGSGNDQVQAVVYTWNSCNAISINSNNQLSGTWKWMNASSTQNGFNMLGIGCRVS